MFPRPIAEPAAAMMKPKDEENSPRDVPLIGQYLMEISLFYYKTALKLLNKLWKAKKGMFVF